MTGNLSYVPSSRASTLITIRSNMHPFIDHRIVTHYFSRTIRAKTIIPIVPIIRALHFVRGPSSIRCDRAIGQRSCHLIRAPRTFACGILGATCVRPCDPFFASSTSIMRTSKVPIGLIRKGERGVGVAAPFSLGITRTILSS